MTVITDSLSIPRLDRATKPGRQWKVRVGTWAKDHFLLIPKDVGRHSANAK